ncbi:MAG: ATP-binding cassette domain-containing protein, partial [Deltaproteobacteria bacterium]
MIAAAGVVRSYLRGGRELRVLDGVELAIAEGETVLLQGESGSGKTTLLSILGGLDAGFSGSVRLCDVELSGLREPARSRLRARTVGFVFQDHNLLPKLTALENLRLPFAFRA